MLNVSPAGLLVADVRRIVFAMCVPKVWRIGAI